MEIDLVYLWVNGNDPVWQAKHDAYTGRVKSAVDINCKGRYADNEELRYSLRSVEMNAPWVRHIYIVTDNQVPAWLDTSSPKVSIVDHRDILPAECLPCFNSVIIEYFIYRIPGLAEHFLYANDDTFINRPITEADFFSADGLPIVRLRRKRFRRLRWFWKTYVCRKPLSNYRATVALAAQLVNRKYGKYYNAMPHHCMDAYLKSDYRHVIEEVMRDEVRANLKNHIRSERDIQRVVFSYILLAEKRGQLRYVGESESINVAIHRRSKYELLDTCRPLFFCLNDSESAGDDDRATAKALMEKRFPRKSQYEK
ncbi:MAG: Stealth CR1 domain-containing protein [Bacteroidaceae bacterium]|nr:Stealth CR1 domain-containing protein [Bacteroidaceae bacterium]